MNVEDRFGTDALEKRRWIEEDSPWKAQKIHQILSENKANPSSVGEIGCGTGGVLYNLSKFYDKSVEFYGYETYPEAYNACLTKKLDNVHFFCKDLLKEDVYYDVVMAINVFTHVRDYLGFLSELRKKGEYKVFHVPLQVTVMSTLRSRYFQNKPDMQSHLHHFNKDTALGTLKATGYEIVDYFYTSGYLDLPDRARWSNLWNIPVKLLYAINKDLAARVFGGFSLMVLTK